MQSSKYTYAIGLYNGDGLCFLWGTSWSWRGSWSVCK